MSNLSTVQGIYEAFGRGDVPTILAALAPDVAWESWTGNSAQAEHVPWMAPRHRREDVVGFFQEVGSWSIESFQVHSFLEGGDQVVAEVEMHATLPGGGRIDDEELHLWTFGPEGTVVRFRHYVDTAKHIAAARAAAGAAPART